MDMENGKTNYEIEFVLIYRLSTVTIITTKLIKVNPQDGEMQSNFKL